MGLWWKDQAGRMWGVRGVATVVVIAVPGISGFSDEVAESGAVMVDRWSTACSMTTYGVFGASLSVDVRERISAWSFGAAIGVMKAV